MIADFVESGLLGLEVYFPKHTNEEVDILRNIAQKFKLYITGGSDWHGKIYTPKIEIGIELPQQDIMAFLSDKRIGIL